MFFKMPRWLCALGVAAMAASGVSAFAADLQSDDFSGGIKPVWKQADVGQDDGGSAVAEGGQLLATGSGPDIWDGTYQYFMLYQDDITSDFVATVKVNQLPTNSDSGTPTVLSDWSSAGILVSSPNVLNWNNPDDPNFRVQGSVPPWFTIAPSRDYGFQVKSGAAGAGSLSFTTGTKIATYPVWVRVQRLGGTLSASYSNDGTTFSPITGSAPVTNTQYEGPVVVGLMVQNHMGTTLSTAIFDDFTVTSANSGIVTGKFPANSGVGATAQALDADGKLVSSATVGADGTFNLHAPAGSYTVTFTGNGLDNVENTDQLTRAGVAVTAGQTTTLDMSNLILDPQISLATGSPNLEGSWLVKTDLTAGDYADKDPAADESGYVEVTVPTDLKTLTDLVTVADNTDLAYRVKFGVPAELQGKDLVLYNFDVDDGVSKVFLNGTDLTSYSEAGSAWPNYWAVQQKYVVPAAAVKATGNVLEIFVHQGGGGAGIVTNPPLLHTLYTSRGGVKGTVKDSTGAFVSAQLKLRDANGADVATGYSSGPINGTFLLAPVPAGSYKLIATTGTGASAPLDVTVAAGAIQNVDLTVAPLAIISWSTGSTDTSVTAKLGADTATPYLYGFTDFSPINPAFNDADWVDIEVPGDAAGSVAANSYFWYRIHFTIPGAFQSQKDKLLYLTNFNSDDNDVTFVNGHYVGATNGWDVKRNYVVPSAYVNWTGDNVVAIQVWQGTGGAGFNKTFAEGYTQDLKAAPTTEGAIYGRVVTDKGGEVGGMTVTLQPPTGDPLTTTTDFFDGSYRFVGLAPNDYTLKVGEGAAAAVTVAGGALTTVADTKLASTGFGPADLAPVDVNTLVVKDIGTADAGSFAGGTFTAGGADIWNNTDSFSLAEAPTHVNGDFTAVVNALPGGLVNEWAKAGIMVRATDEAGSVNVAALNAFIHGSTLQIRPVADQASSSVGGSGPVDLNHTIMLTRQGDVFSMYRANSDGSNATLINQQTLAGFPKDLILGLAATSHLEGTTADAKFSNFKVSNTGWSPSGVVVPPTGCLGNVTDDNAVDVQDAVAILRHVVNLGDPLTGQKLTNANVNGDAGVDVQDAVIVLQAIVDIAPGNTIITNLACGG